MLFAKMETIPPSGEFTPGAASSVAAPPCTISSVMPAPPSWECSLSYFFKSVIAADAALSSGASRLASSIMPPSVESMTLWQMLDGPSPVIIFLHKTCLELGMTYESFAAEWVSFARDQPNAMPSWSALRSLRHRIIQRKSGSPEFASEISKCFLQLGHRLDTPEITFLRVICSELGMTPASFVDQWASFARNQPNARPSLSSLSSIALLDKSSLFSLPYFEATLSCRVYSCCGGTLC